MTIGANWRIGFCKKGDDEKTVSQLLEIAERAFEVSYTLSVPHVVHDPNGETHFLPAGTQLVVATPQQVEASTKVAEVSALIDANKMGEARALLNEIAAALGEGNVDVVGLRTMLHFMDTVGGAEAS